MFFHYTSSKLINLCNQSVQKFTVVRNYYHRTVKFTDSLFQHILGTHIQVVGRFVQYQEVLPVPATVLSSPVASLPSRKHLYFLSEASPPNINAPNISRIFKRISPLATESIVSKQSDFHQAAAPDSVQNSRSVHCVLLPAFLRMEFHP